MMSSNAETGLNAVPAVARKPQYVFFLLLVIAWLVQRFVPGLFLGYGLLGVAGAFFSIYLLSSVLHGKTENILVAWVLLFPLGYYFLSFPRDNPSFTFDRLVVGVLLAGMLFAGRTKAASTPVPLRQSALAWAFFILAVALSFLQLRSVPSLLRVLVDAFILPPLLGWYVIRSFRVRAHLVALHLVICLVAAYLAAIGIAEILTGEDIFPVGQEIYKAGLTDLIFRPNGPFAADQSYGLIGLISFCFLLFLWRALPQKPPNWHRAIHAVGVVAAAMTALLPLFRSIAISLLLIASWDIYSRRKRAALPWLLGFGACIAALLVTANIYFPEIIQERVLSLENVYGRVAQQRQTFELFSSHPLLGVGFSNFTRAAGQLTDSATYLDVAALDAPHSNFGAVLAETGLLGFVPYFLSQILLLRAFWKMRTRDTVDARFVWKMFLYVFVSYWFTGLSLTSGYYLDVNMWFLFAVCCIYKYGLTEDSSLNSFANQ
jgi:O-antigen ligase